MLITENNKRLYFNITGYQFPNATSSNEEYNYDANWLNCEIKYSEGDFNETYTDPCLLTYELEELIDAISKILDDTESIFISDFMEPYLKISIAKVEDKVIFIFQFTYDTLSDIWKSWKIVSSVERDCAVQILNELKKIQNSYPER